MDYFFGLVDVDQDDKWTMQDLRHFHKEKEMMWLRDRVAVSDLHDLWVSLMDRVGRQHLQKSQSIDMDMLLGMGKGLGEGRKIRERGWEGDVTGGCGGGVSRRDVLKLAAKERKMILQMVLFVDDDYSSVNIRRTMELNKNCSSPVVVM